MNKNNKPSITIVTPSFNQGEFIERTILSVLNQNYPNLQYIIKDGGSTDNTKQIVKKYQKYLTFISKKDNGQSDAINQGFKMANGEILAWLNSDDCYKPGTLDYVGNFFKNNQNSYWLTGDYEIIDKNDNVIREYVAIYKKLLRSISNKSVLCVANYIVQPSTFWKKSLFEKIGDINVDFKYNMDYEYWLRAFKQYDLHVTNEKLCQFRIHSESINGSRYKKMFDHELTFLNKYCSSNLLFNLHKVHNFFNITIYNLTKID